MGTPTNITPINTVAQLSILDTGTNMTVSLTNANLNSYLRFDDSQWNWGSVPVPLRGTFGFVLLPDGLGAANRVIAVSYAPVPEPALVLTIAVSGLIAGGLVRRRLQRRLSSSASK